MAWIKLPKGVAAFPFTGFLRAEYQTQVTPGDFFGDPTHIRLAFGGNPEVVEEGLKRLGAGLAAFAG